MTYRALLQGCSHCLFCVGHLVAALVWRSLLAFGLLFGSNASWAMPESEFQQLRQQVFALADTYYPAAIVKIDQILQSAPLSLEQGIRLRYSKATYLHRTNQTEAAIRLLADCKELSLESSDPSILYSYYNNLGAIFDDLHLYQPALNMYRQALVKAEFLPNTRYSEQTGNNLGLVLLKLDQFQEAHELFIRFLAGAQRRQNVDEEAVAVNNLGELELKAGRLDSADVLFQRALALKQQHGISQSLSYSYVSLAQLAAARQRWVDSASHAEHALLLRQQKNDVSKIEPGLLLAEALYQLSETARAEQVLQQSLQLAQQHADLSAQIRGYQLQAQLSERLGKPLQALAAIKLALKAQAEQANRNFAVQLAQASADSMLQLRESQVRQLNHQNQLQTAEQQSSRRWYLTVLTATALLLLLTGGFVWQLQRKNQLLAQHIDELEQTRAQLVEAEKMAALTSLVSGMAHQLNTPLGNLITAQSFLAEQLTHVQTLFSQKQLSASQLATALSDSEQALTLARGNAERAAQLIDQFKQFSSQLQEQRQQQLSLNSLCRDQLSWLKQEVTARGGTAHTQCVGEELFVTTDPLLVHRVLHSVLQNCIDHALQTGTPLQVALCLQQQQGQIQLYVADNGPGIAMDQRRRIFEPFVGSRWGHGQAGLGLSVAFNAATQLGGSVAALDPSAWPAAQPTDFHIGALLLCQFPRSLSSSDEGSNLHSPNSQPPS